MSKHCRPMRAFLKWGAGTAAVLSALSTQAAVLGHSRVVSLPDQPLRITVMLKDLSPAEMASLTATVAPRAAWQEAGLTTPVDLASLRLKTIAATQPNALQLLLESSQVAPDAVIDVLLDISTDVSTQRHQVSVLQSPQPTPIALAQPAIRFVAPVTSPEINAAHTATPTVAAQTHRIRSGQTLSHIARQYRSSEYSEQQFMAALLDANPHAFIHNNLNLIRAGAVLTIPDAQAIRAISPQQANQLYRTHLQWFDDYRQRLAQGQPLAPLADSLVTPTQTAPLEVVTEAVEPDPVVEQAIAEIDTVASSPALPMTAEAEAEAPDSTAALQPDRLQLSTEEPVSLQADQNTAIAQELAYTAERLAQLENDATATTIADTNLAGMTSTPTATNSAAAANAGAATPELAGPTESATSSDSTTTSAPSTMVPAVAPAQSVATGASEQSTQASLESALKTKGLWWGLALLSLMALSMAWFLRRSNTSRLDVVDELSPSAVRMRDKLEKNTDNLAPHTDEVEFREIK